MTVFAVMVLVDDEYGGRVIDAIFSTETAAAAYIQMHGQRMIETWYGEEAQYTIEEHEVFERP